MRAQCFETIDVFFDKKIRKKGHAIDSFGP